MNSKIRSASVNGPCVLWDERKALINQGEKPCPACMRGGSRSAGTHRAPEQHRYVCCVPALWLVAPALGLIPLYSLGWGSGLGGGCSEASCCILRPPTNRVRSPEAAGAPGFKPLSYLAVKLEINTSPGARPQAAEDFPISPWHFFICLRIALAFFSVARPEAARRGYPPPVSCCFPGQNLSSSK